MFGTSKEQKWNRRQGSQYQWSLAVLVVRKKQLLKLQFSSLKNRLRMISNWKPQNVVAECFKESHGNFPNGATWIVRRRWLTGKCLLYKCSTLWRYVNTLWSPSSAWSTVFNGHVLACFRSFLSGLSNLSEGQFFPSRKTRHIPTM